MEFNKKQTEAYEKIHKFVESSTLKHFYLFGYAGTGKTYLMSKVIRSLIDENKINHVYLCAPTHTALNVLESYFKSEFSEESATTLKSKMTFMTIHKLLGLKPTISMDTGTKIFKSTTESKFLKHFSNKLIVLDECSMLCADISKDIEKYLSLYPLKIIFMGDKAQLPPVSEPESLIFNVGSNYEFMINLDEVMRTKSLEIKEVSSVIRNWNLTDKLETVVQGLVGVHKKKNSKFKMYHQSKNTWFKKIQSIIKKKGIPPVILTWTNEKSRSYNELIRKDIHKNVDITINTYIPGDHMMFGAYYLGPDRTQYFTADTVRLVSIKKQQIKLYDWNNAKLVKCINKAELAYNVLVRKFAGFNHDIDVDELVVVRIGSDFSKELTDDDFTEKIIMTIHNEESNTTKYDILTKNIKTDIETFFKTHNSERLSTKLWNIFHKYIQEPYAKLTFRYSTTIHKSQSSTYNYVFVDLADVSKNHNKPELSKALYTATTRVSEELYFLI